MTRSGWSTFTDANGKAYSSYLFDTAWTHENYSAVVHKYRLICFLSDLEVLNLHETRSDDMMTIEIDHD